ncbi:MAG TPA: glycosyltransferase family 2 protein [Saprospiraceae bacterium]|nr:glycosyltransferase family 2 protein [Saprospiraceae bacterium]HPN70067.1 glycosyltransferase family 2 protein [Saprospiraceae bacterium]
MDADKGLKNNIQDSKVLLVIPCYNEESNVLSLYESIQKALPFAGMVVDVLFIDDCSNDKTRDVLIENDMPHIALAVNLGIGGAVQTGIKYASQYNYDWVIQMDGDGQHPAEELSIFFETAIMQNPDLIIGSRFLEKMGFQSTRLRRTGIGFFRALIRRLTGVAVTDPTSGFRMLGRKTIERACEYYPDEYPEPEILLDCLLRGFKVREIPVEMKERQGGISSIRSFFQVYYMMKVSLSMFFQYLRFRLNN